METTVIQTRVETSLKKEAEEFFQSVGLDMTTAIRLFLNQVLIQKKIPFEIESKESISRAQALENFYAMRAGARNLQEMSLDEINAEIQCVRERSKAKAYK
ncbi:DNA-damage-inducible protein J [Fibrobacter sp. UWH9]|uniref:type II toxin-antitoxin system RelB/DinJ family antitoxin n=1 Tax=unclassified Fibrobacter TaxID=2634177 RepID=UPI0009101BE4|nr:MULTISPECIES: type II toxin-antitoxin system RelB/DinJ family antitoxin [Fibrobacter]MCQ2100663.1 type II toxin-antitoxin system RelB/DinJ family antitoxin [Fibrobacter sp.]MCL4102769.1 hypothetical protein [Fibrobacter succinogenes]MDO4946766.1 type II toxin-antitoxin system RelB/DinJ family antitoxin [Fibrobacter sp.]OWV04107.1 hypothetical protein B7993_11790 [Fibrobacter sp. UWH3]OWV09624.1 hypothetical protein B7992_12020 [Fibrobacter sp. UWH1]